MALEQEKSQIAPAAQQIGIQRFRTNDMPDPGAATLAGSQKLAGTIQSINDQTMKDDADKAAQEEAGKAVIAKDAQGNYLYPPAPDTFGSYARKAYEGLVDAQYKNQVVQDAQLQFNQIATEHALDPSTAMQKMDAYRQGVMKSVDPRFAGPIQASLTHELAERQHGLLQTNFALDRKNAIDAANTKISSNMDDALERYSRGDTAGGDALLDENLGLKQKIQAQKGGDVDLDAESTMKTSMQTTGTVLNELRQKVTDGSISEQQLNNLILRINGYTTSDAGPVLGVNDQVIDDGIKNPAVRKLLAGRVDKLRSELAGVFAGQKADLQYDNLIRYYDHGGRGAVGTMSTDAQDQLVSTWADKTFKDEGGRLFLQSPAGMKAAFDKFGFLPTKTIESTFRGVSGMQTPDIEQRYQIWKQLDKMPSLDGGSVVSMRGAIGSDDDAFMRQYDITRGSQGPSEQAANNARTAMQPANREIASQGKQGLIRYAGGPMGANDPQFNEAKLDQLIDKHLPPDPAKSWLLPVGYKMIGLPDPVKADMIALTNQRLAMGGTVDEAMSWAGSRITRMWRPDPKLLTGWSRSEEGIPTATAPDGRASTDYTGKYWEKIRDSGKFSLPGNVPVPKTAAEGTDVFYQPNGNGTFNVMYKVAGTTQIYPVVGKDNGRPLVVDFGMASRKQNKVVADQIDQRQKDVTAQTSSYNPLSGSTLQSTPSIKDPVMDVANAADPDMQRAAMQRLGAAGKRADDPAKGVGSGDITQPAWAPAELSDVIRTPPDPKAMMPGRIDKPTKGAATSSGVATGDGSEAIQVRPGVDLHVRPEVRAVMDDIGTAFPKVEVTSGYRDPTHNAAVGGARGSQHMHANAFDISLRGLSIPEKGELMDHITKNPLIGGIGYYPNDDSMHIDLRAGHVAWGQNRSASSLPATPDWYKRRILPWLNGGN